MLLRPRPGPPAGQTRGRTPLLLLATGLACTLAACGTTAAAAARTSQTSTPAPAASMSEYVAGHWIDFTSATALTPAQWSVVDAYATFSSAVLAVYTTHSVAPLATVVSPQSKVPAMFTRDLATGTNPEAVYVKASVLAVRITGCRASLALELFYPGGRRLHYVSSWVRPFDRASLAHHPNRAQRHAARAAAQHAPWLFVGDNRVGGVDTPCGI